MNDDHRAADANSDPRTGVPRAPSAPPEGTGIGAIVAGTAARAAAATVSTPVDTDVGACIGTVVGRRAGKGVAEAIDPARERAYWRENFSGRDYVEKGSSFDDYGPAFGFGVNARGRYPGRDLDDVESELSRDWAASRGASHLSRAQAKPAARDAWNRISPSS